MKQIEKSIKAALIKNNKLIFILFAFLILCGFFIITLQIHQNNSLYYKNLGKNLISDYIVTNESNEKGNSPEFKFKFQTVRFLMDNFPLTKDIKIFGFSDESKIWTDYAINRENEEKQTIADTQLSFQQSKYIYPLVENKIIKNKSNSKKFFIQLYHFSYFYVFPVTTKDYLILKVPLLHFYNYTFFYLILIIVFILIFFILFYFFTIRYYRRFVNNIHKIYFYITNLLEGDYNEPILNTNIQELDILIEKIKLLKNEFLQKKKYYTSSLELFKSCVFNITDPVIFFNSDLSIIDCNQAASEIISTESLGKIDSVDLLNTSSAEIELLKNRIKEKNSENKKININKTPYYSTLFFGEDYNCLLLKNTPCDETNFLAHNEVEFLRDFINNVSHELRSPLNSIIGFSDIIIQGIEGEVEPEILNDINIINDSGKKLLKLINELILFSKLSYDQKEYSVGKYKIDEVIHLFNTFFFGFLKKKIIDLEIINNFSEEIAIDRDLTFHLFLHLFSYILKNFKTVKFYFHLLPVDDKYFFCFTPEKSLDLDKEREFLEKSPKTELQDQIIKENVHLYYAWILAEKCKYSLYINKLDDSIKMIITS